MYYVLRVYDTTYNGVEYGVRFYGTLEEAIAYANTERDAFCDSYGIPEEERFYHEYGDSNLNSVYYDIDGEGTFEFETEGADRLHVEIGEVRQSEININ